MKPEYLKCTSLEINVISSSICHWMNPFFNDWNFHYKGHNYAIQLESFTPSEIEASMP